MCKCKIIFYFVLLIIYIWVYSGTGQIITYLNSPSNSIILGLDL